MALNTLFPRQRELVNYDYFDIAEGVGYVVYFGLKGNDGEFIVSTTDKIYSGDICTFKNTAQTITTSFTKIYDMDFDLTFNRPKNIKGVVTANIPIGLATPNTGPDDFEFYAIVKTAHWEGSTETILATGQSRTLDGRNMGTGIRAFNAMIATCRMDVTIQKHFKKGETLRFIVEGWFKTTESSSRTCHALICHDPKNRNFKPEAVGGFVEIPISFANEKPNGGTVTYQNTQMIFHVPFVLDV